MIKTSAQLLWESTIYGDVWRRQQAAVHAHEVCPASQIRDWQQGLVGQTDDWYQVAYARYMELGAQVEAAHAEVLARLRDATLRVSVRVEGIRPLACHTNYYTSRTTSRVTLADGSYVTSGHLITVRGAYHCRTATHELPDAVVNHWFE